MQCIIDGKQFIVYLGVIMVIFLYIYVLLLWVGEEDGGRVMARQCEGRLFSRQAYPNLGGAETEKSNLWRWGKPIERVCRGSWRRLCCLSQEAEAIVLFQFFPIGVAREAIYRWWQEWPVMTGGDVCMGGCSPHPQCQSRQLLCYYWTNICYYWQQPVLCGRVGREAWVLLTDILIIFLLQTWQTKHVLPAAIILQEAWYQRLSEITYNLWH